MSAADLRARVQEASELPFPSPPVVLDPDRVPVPSSGLLRRAWSLLTAMRGAVLFGACAAAAAVAAGGVAVLFWLAVTRALTPGTVVHWRPLYFDYTHKTAVASALFVADTDPLAQGARFLARGQPVDIWLDLEVPAGKQEPDICQVVAELVTADARVAAAISRPVLIPPRATLLASIREVVTLPLALVGLWSDSATMPVALWTAYRDRDEAPFALFRVALKPRAGRDTLPRLYGARVRVELHLGFLRRFLYMLRPNTLLALALAATALTAAAGGSATAALLFVVLLYSSGLLGGGGSRATADDDTGSEASMSHASSGALADSEGEEAGSEPGPEPLRGTSSAGASVLSDEVPASLVARAAAKAAAVAGSAPSTSGASSLPGMARLSSREELAALADAVADAAAQPQGARPPGVSPARTLVRRRGRPY